MSIKTLHNLSDWTLESNVIEDPVNYKNTSPGLFLANTGSPFILYDTTQVHNESFVSWFKCVDNSLLKFQYMFGSNNLGDGFAFEITKTDVRLIQTSLFLESAVIMEKDISRISTIASNTFTEVKILIVNMKVQLYINHLLIMEYNSFIGVGNHYGYYNHNGNDDIYVSDTIYYGDQIIWGNVNINGQSNQSGFTLLFNQLDINFIESANCDSSGNWMIFIEEDPYQQNKHILVGAILSEQFLQPKGISSITL